jgi:hypothetical protein
MQTDNIPNMSVCCKCNTKFIGTRCLHCKPLTRSDDEKLTQYFSFSSKVMSPPRTCSTCPTCLSLLLGDEECEDCSSNFKLIKGNYSFKLEEGSKDTCVQCTNSITSNDRIVYRRTIKTGEVSPCHEACSLVTRYVGSDIYEWLDAAPKLNCQTIQQHAPELKNKCPYCDRNINTNDRNIVQRISVKTGETRLCHEDCCSLHRCVGSIMYDWIRVSPPDML